MYTHLILYIICIYCSLDSMHQGLVILSGKKKKRVVGCGKTNLFHKYEQIQ